MSRLKIGVLIIAMLGGFLVLLAGGQLLKQPLSPEEDIAAFLQQLDPILREGDQWREALHLQEQIEHGWSRVEKRIQFSIEREDMMEFTEELVRLKAAIEMEEQPMAWEAHRLLKTVWNRMR